MNFHLPGVVFVGILLLGCTTHQIQGNQDWSDPLESFNRSMFNFNYNVLDPYVVRPAAVAWQHYVPQPARNGLNNFLMNLKEPATMVNYFIARKPRKAAVHFNRFFLNTLLGMGGLIDVASMANPKLDKEEPRRFGSTLGYYGVGYGPYIHLPGYGSFTLREDIGGFVDALYPLLSCLTWWMSAGKWVLEGLETRTQLLGSDGLLQTSQDPYSMIRVAYFQQHDFLANDGMLTPQENLNTETVQDAFNLIDTQ
ncbi:phospholipid-binding lipoprotein MlaA [Candidatus Doolittlea endobia]|uniref:Putative phospholipid-binding lipoprotein MlaA n=1 Tax=Candidatus Doolittlea endobia TaxID=1778262 RepID=A0A143WSW5_9ENTR|nr:phospholipid-binding lipoprotein MlaA [Candidatus Doolittlea endobia]CUX96874.1 putative phospholipid-binding lipoprotein MlaA precursor [Candidatus Doolittlea endobia]